MLYPLSYGGMKVPSQNTHHILAEHERISVRGSRPQRGTTPSATGSRDIGQPQLVHRRNSSFLASLRSVVPAHQNL